MTKNIACKIRTLGILILSLMVLTACNTYNTQTIAEKSVDLYSTETEGWADESKSQYNSKLPVVYINTEDSKINKKEYSNATLKIQGNDLWPEQYDGPIQVKGRGNSSWVMDKKPLKIKLDKKTSLFDMNKSKHWALLANYIDESNMKNRIANDLAESIGLLSMKSTWVQVVLDGSYAGLYQLSESIRPEVVDGLLFEVSAEYDEDIQFRTSTSKWPIMVISTDEVTKEPELLDHAKEIWNRFDEAVSSEDGYASDGTYYADLIDMDSWIKYWMIVELMNNSDASKKSRYVSLNGEDKLVFGPIWDSDFSLNTSPKIYTDLYWSKESHALDDPIGWSVMVSTNENNFLNSLFSHEDFKERAFELFRTEFAPAVSTYLDSNTIEGYYDYLKDAALANESLWRFDRGFNGDYEAMYSFLKERFEWMKNEIQ